jgi:hypothetical protein
LVVEGVRSWVAEPAGEPSTVGLLEDGSERVDAVTHATPATAAMSTTGASQRTMLRRGMAG